MSLFENGFMIVQDALHYAEGSVTSAVTGLPEWDTLPVNQRRIRRCLIHNVGAKVRWVAVDGIDPQDDFGDTLDADDILVYDGNPGAISFILDATAGGNSVLRVHYFGI